MTILRVFPRADESASRGAVRIDDDGSVLTLTTRVREKSR